MVLDSFLQKYIFHSSSRTTVHFGNTTKGVSLKQLQGRGKQWDEIALVSYPFFCLGFFSLCRFVLCFFFFFFSRRAIRMRQFRDLGVGCLMLDAYRGRHGVG